MAREPEQLNTGLGAAIRDRRLSCGLALKRVADMAGMNKNTLWRIERGIRPCRVSELDAIATALDVDPASLLQTILVPAGGS